MQTPGASLRTPRLWPFKRVYYGWAIVWASTVAAFGMAPMFGPVLGVFLSSIEEELGWSRATISLAFTLGSATGLIMQFLIGRLLDRYGARMVVVAAGIIIALAMVGLSWMHEPWHFWVAFGAGRGSALAGIQLGTGVALSNWFLRKRGRTIAILGIGQSTGQAIMPMAIFAIMAVAGWRVAFLSLAGVTAILIIMPALLYLRRRPEDLGMTLENMTPEQLAEMKRGGGERRGLARLSRQVRDVSFTLAEAKRTRAFWLVLFFVIMERFALGSINLHVSANFEDKGLALVLAVSVLSIFAATSALTSLPWGFVFERLDIRFGAMLISGILTVSALLLLVADNYPLAVLFAVLFGLATGAGNIIQDLLWVEYFGRKHIGAIRGFSAPFRIVIPIGPVFTGFLFDWTGSYTVPFLVFTVIFMVMTAAMYFATPPVKPAESGEG